MNAHTDGDIVTCDVCEFEEAPLFPMPDGTPGDPAKAIPRLTRWTFDLAKNTNDYKWERLDDLACEFPRLDDRYAGANYRYGYFAADKNPQFKVGGFNAIGRRDHETGKVELHDVGEACATNEPIFVPRSADAPEGDGFLLANVYDANRKASHLVILDAQNVSGEPLAKAYLDHRVPFGFHGNWAQDVA
jgi:carotenoid cleavage dioxygenase